MLKNMNKTKRSNLITYAIVIVAFVVMQTLSSTGSISSLLTGLLVPLCTYIILAVSLNLVVGILGELSLGHAGFMCVGAFSSAFFSKCMRDVIENSIVRFLRDGEIVAYDTHQNLKRNNIEYQRLLNELY